MFNVLSLFDGISCGQIALNRVGIKYDNYFASEIDKNAIKVTQHNYPTTLQLGDVTQVKGADLPPIQLMIGGFPCQSLSCAGKQEGFSGKSGLFYEWVRLFKEVNPKYFLVENVSMKKEWENVITQTLGVEPLRINSSLLSAQNRVRLYWTNIPNVKIPEDKNIALADIIEESYDGIWVWPRGGNPGGVQSYNGKSPSVTTSSWQHNFYIYRGAALRYRYKDGKPFCSLETRNDNKSNCVVTSPYKDKYLLEKEGQIRKFTPTEVERLQTVPESYTSVISDNQRYKALGNGWTVDVIAHIFKNIEY